MKVLISTSTFGESDQEPLEILKRAGLAFQLNPHRRKLTKEEVVELAGDAVGIIAGTEPLSRDVLEKLESLKVISRCGAGIDNVDAQSAAERGVKVYSTPLGPTRAVAELALGLILDCLRGISQSDRSIRQGRWQKPMGWLLRGKTIGVVGFGRIGKEISRMLQALGATVLAYDISPPAETFGVKMVSLDELVASSDIISLHIPSDAGCPINAQTIAKMKNDAIVINTSRGNLIDEDALYEALQSGKIAAAGIDTPPEEPYKGKLKALDSVVLTAHIGSYAKEARVEMEKQAVLNLLDGLNVKTV